MEIKPQTPKRLQLWLTPLLFIAVSLLFYRPAASIFFCMDDLGFLRQAALLDPWPPSIWRLISTRGFFSVAWNLFGSNAEYYHFIILTLHGLSAWLVTQVSRRLNLTQQSSIIAGFFFLFSPAAFTSLHWISGGQEVFFALFCLLTTLSFLTEGRWQYLAIPLFGLTLLTKEAGVFLLPVLCLVMPMTNPMPLIRRLTLAGSGVLIAAAVLIFVNSARVPEAGDPYATGFGLNIVQTLLTHLAWLVRVWDFYPDRIATNMPALWPWGLFIPAILIALVIRNKSWRKPTTQASIIFLALLAPVLPLLRHSYHYYTMVPLISLWILAASALGKLPRNWQKSAYLLPLLLALLTGWQGHMRRNDMMNERLHADPVIRYAHLVKTAVENLKATEGPLDTEIVILPGVMAKESMHLSANNSVEKNQKRIRFLMLERALKNIDNLCLFFPELESATLVRDLDEIPSNDWLNQHLYFNTGMVGFKYLGKGVGGSYAYAGRMFGGEHYGKARRELERLLRLSPGQPRFISELGMIGIATNNQALVDSVLTDLQNRSETGPYKKEAQQELNLLLSKTKKPGSH
ncbi:MAG: hypothetical protein GY780_09075 [bacterium]|nr:hypothetical protein [bacterium]